MTPPDFLMRLAPFETPLLADAFTPRLRYSGASIGYQLASIIAGGPAPFVAPWLFSTYHSALPIAFYVSVRAAISICVALLLPDKTNKDIAHEVSVPRALGRAEPGATRYEKRPFFESHAGCFRPRSQ